MILYYTAKEKNMAFIGIKIPADVARTFRNLELPGERVAESEYHITILMFDENWPIREVAKAMEASFEVLNKTEPFLISCNTIACFPKQNDNPCPLIAKVKSKELQTLNSELKKEFDKGEIFYDKTFKNFKPHITLSYADKEIDEIKLDSPIEFIVHEVVLWGGDHGDDRIFITFPLKGVETKKHNYLLQKADIFYKLSKKDPNELLSHTVERRKLQR